MDRQARCIDPDALPRRLDSLPGIAALRKAAAGLPAFLVGGAVRDLLLGRTRADLDVALEGGVAEMARRLGGEMRGHERFGTATVRSGGLQVDLAATRTETYPRPGALPEVRPAPLSSDLARRDFTINAMALPLAGEPRLIDPHGGLGDLRAGLLRILHSRSFVDDPTRALRAARYAARFGFACERRTGELLRGADLGTVSADRVRAELRRLAAEPEAPRGFELLAEWGLADIDRAAAARARAVARVLGDGRWATRADRTEALLAAVGRDSAETAADLARAEPRAPSEAVALAAEHPWSVLAVARAMDAAWLDRYLREWEGVSLEIDGGDLLAAGVPEGPDVGRGLDAALRAKLDGRASGREEELRIALAAARGS